MEIVSVFVLVRGLTMGYTYKGGDRDFLDLRFMATLINNLRELGHGGLDLEVVFRDTRDKRIPMHWWIAENRDGAQYLDYCEEE